MSCTSPPRAWAQIDTNALRHNLNKYRNEKETYPDACQQDYKQQLAWIDSVLTAAKEDWVIVAGQEGCAHEFAASGRLLRILRGSLRPFVLRRCFVFAGIWLRTGE